VEIAEFIRDNDLDVLLLTETWLKESGDEAKCAELTPAGYSIRSAPRPSLGGGIAVIFRTALNSHLTFDASLPFAHPSFEAVHVTLAVGSRPLHLFCIYRPPPSTKNKLTESMFFTDFNDLLDLSNSVNGSPLILGDINLPFNKPTLPSTSKLLGLIEEFRFSQSVNEPTHVKGNTLDWVMHRPEDGIVKSTAVTQALSSDHYCVMCELSALRPSPPSLFRTVRSLRSLDMRSRRKTSSSSKMTGTPKLAQTPTTIGQGQ
jgi:endonuclease/exonuclease/phosphatase (EEP) superfamily protein YafD